MSVKGQAELWDPRKALPPRLMSHCAKRRHPSCFSLQCACPCHDNAEPRECAPRKWRQLVALAPLLLSGCAWFMESWEI